MLKYFVLLLILITSILSSLNAHLPSEINNLKEIERLVIAESLEGKLKFIDFTPLALLYMGNSQWDRAKICLDIELTNINRKINFLHGTQIAYILGKITFGMWTAMFVNDERNLYSDLLKHKAFIINNIEHCRKHQLQM